MCSMRLLANHIPNVTGKTFSKKYISLGRIITHWDIIIGKEMADKAQPFKIHYRKPKKKNEKPQAELEITTTSAHASVLQYQTDLILERINQVFGERWITKIKFSHITQPAKQKSSKPPEIQKKLSEEETQRLNDWLHPVEDQAMKDRLQKFGSLFLSKNS